MDKDFICVGLLPNYYETELTKLIKYEATKIIVVMIIKPVN